MTWGDAMKDIKEKPTKSVPRSNAAGKIPKAAHKSLLHFVNSEYRLLMNALKRTARI